MRIFLGPLNVEGVAESLESSEKYKLLGSQQGALRVENASGKGSLQPTWEICFAQFLYCFKLIRLMYDTLFLSASHQTLPVVLCLRIKSIFIVGFQHGFSKFMLML